MIVLLKKENNPCYNLNVLNSVKCRKGRNTGLAHRGSSVSFGTIALKSVERGQMTARQIEAARRTISRRIKRGGKIFIRVFPDKPITSKPLRSAYG